MTDDDNRRERVQRGLDHGRRFLERGVQELGGVVSRGVRAVSAGSGEAASPPPKGDRDSTGQPDVEVVAADPVAYFSEQRQREAEELGHANILITGQTGVGKSTLINAIFRTELAEEGVGRPVTKRVQRHDAPGVPVTIFDTPGIELGDAKDAVVSDFRDTITASRRGAPEGFIHIAWYCIDAGQTRIQGYDVDIVRALAHDVPVILVLTQCVDEDRAIAL
ncbi:MAG: GTPase, partial [Solirubrobacteraceae bacterium]